jgi:polysaccharide biosynthesis protein PslH
MIVAQHRRAATRSGARLRLLFLCQTLPFPPTGGAKIRAYHVLRLLSGTFDVTALCFYRWKAGRLEQDIASSVQALQRFGMVEAFPIPQEHSRWRLISDHGRSVAFGRTYTAYAYASAAFTDRLNELLRTQEFDLVHADSLDLSGYFPMLKDLPIVCTHHDVQSDLLRRRAMQESGWRRRYVAHQARLMEREERYWCPRVTLNVNVSPRDAQAMAQLAADARFAVVPNGVDLEYFKPEPNPGTGAVFVGGTTWFPNRDALQYFHADILPRLRDAGERAPVTWVGRATKREREQYSADGLELTGFVEDIRPYVHGAACYIVPLRVGGGTRIKILDAWAMGKAVVSTSVGCEGLNAIDGQNILVRDTPGEFCDAICQVLNDSELRNRLGRAGRTTVEETYGWQAIGERMVAEYLGLLGDPFNGPRLLQGP